MNPTARDTSNAPDAAATRRLPATMQVLTARRYGATEVLAMEELPVPTPGPGELLLRVEASSLNALDWHFLTGTPYLMRLMFGLRRPRRFVRGADLAGVVVAVGTGVERFRVGDAVFGEGTGGGCGEFATVAEGGVVAIADGVSFEAAAATPIAGLTALQGLRTHAVVQPGERVLINGAAGGVGTMAVQIARALGAHVTAVCSTRNVEMVRALGADEVIDYTSDDFVVGGPRFDVLLDNVGNRRPQECRSVLVAGGRYVAISGPKANRWVDPLPYLLRARMSFVRADASFHQFTATANVDDLTFLGELLASGRLVPQIDRVVGLDGVASALAEIGTGHARAKIVVAPSR
jgi:NADPH:quinone reductase-like Zn-dependent oxidoreductase